MRLLDRYLFRELLTPLAYCLIGIQAFVIFFTVFGDAEKIQEAKLHFLETIEYATAASMEYLTIVLPVSLLMALLMALTQHARHNEITAMRAAGISLWRICAPYFVVGLIASAALFALNESVVPRCLDWTTRVLTRYTQPGKTAPDQNKLDFTDERNHRKWIVSNYHARTGEMDGVQVDWTETNGSSYTLYADRGIRTNDVWTFFNVRELSLTNPAALYYVWQLKTNVLRMPEFDETPREIRAEIEINAFLGFGGLHNPNIPVKDVLAYLQRHPNLLPSEKGRLLTEVQERLASPLTCLVVALIAIPFGAAPGRRNLFFGVAGSIFICFSYFVLQRVCLAFGSNGAWPAWLAAWLPNIFFSLLGLILTARIR